VVQLGPDGFLFAGAGLTVTFETAETGWNAGIGRVSEGCFEREWQRLEPGRMAIQRLSLYRYR
jgi:hypothetical protein